MSDDQELVELINKVQRALTLQLAPYEIRAVLEIAIPLISRQANEKMLAELKIAERTFATLDAGHMAIDKFLDTFARKHGLTI